jgi:hypothetical protein
MIIVTETTTGNTCIIRAQDFSDSLKDDDRNRWTGGKMRHVLAALGDTPVVITTDNQTGHTQVNVKLAGLRTGWAGCGYELGIVDTYEGCPEGGRTVWYRLDSIGDTIVPLPVEGARGDAKWTATRSFNDERSYAVELAQLQHGKTAGREWGNWAAHVGYSEVAVTYTPYPATYADVAPRGERGFWCYKLDECAAQGRMRQQRMHELYPTSYAAPVRRSATCGNNWHRGLFDFMACSECREK